MSMQSEENEWEEVKKRLPPQTVEQKLSSIRHIALSVLNVAQPAVGLLATIDPNSVTGLPEYYREAVEILTKSLSDLRRAVDEYTSKE